jgi:bifunctional non-homologous end joining protein LigD
MGLATYRKKRRFASTPEPRGRKAARKGSLRFVVQKHAASRLHYDFRLELDGVLKSWAVPKGPSMNPADKRLAVQVEDHPLDYRNFEGAIPEGNYGAGSVIVWDRGTYSGTDDDNLDDALAAGRLSIDLRGKKLKGVFSLVRMNRGGEKNWLLIKQKDEFASKSDVTADDKSVKTGRTLAQVANRSAPRARRKRAKRSKAIVADDAPRGAMPHHVRPMLATLVDRPFDRPGWIFELKWDGYRAIAEIEKGNVTVYSRNHKSLHDRFPPIIDALHDFAQTAVLDGEIVALDEQGRARFQLLQNYQKTGRGQLAYYVFDLLHLNGRDLRTLPLLRRKELLARVLAGMSTVRISEHVEENGTAFFQAASNHGLEGIMAKRADSVYREGARSLDWLKIKTHRRQEAVIGGFTEPRRSRPHLGALLLGVYDDGEFIYIGHTGGGFNSDALREVRDRLRPLETARCPFVVQPKPNAPVHWVTPKLVCEVKFQEWTSDGRMRQPIFLAWRDDKPPRSVKRELPVAATEVKHAGNKKATTRKTRR